jgi:hypothetical protein
MEQPIATPVDDLDGGCGGRGRGGGGYASHIGLLKFIPYTIYACVMMCLLHMVMVLVRHS